MIGFGRVRLELERGEDGAEKQPRPELERDEVGVLALPAEARGGGERLFHHGGGVDEHFGFGAGWLDERARDSLELWFDDLLVIIALRVGRDRALSGRFQDRQRVAVG